MNWDWEKLQEKRQRQPGAKKPQPDGTPPPRFPDFGENFKKFKPSFAGGKILLLVALAAWGLSGFFIVSPEEKGVILRFGKYHRTVEPGPHLRLPFPIESHETPQVTSTQRIEIGFRTQRGSVSSAGVRSAPVPVEAAMLTEDENVVMVEFIVQYRIGLNDEDARKFLFNLAGQHETVKSAAEAAMRATIGKCKLDAALTDGKLEIQNETLKELQKILDDYGSGILINTVQMQDVHAPQEVMTAFRDVASAKEEKVQSTNKAEAYRNKYIPEATGIAASTIQEAEAYKTQTIRRAEGESQRFLSILFEYNKAKDVTKKRMYLEAMEAILSSPGMEKIILPKNAGEKILPILPLGVESLTGIQAPHDAQGGKK
ncbi:HflK protein [Deltaproteobacteria bacterium]|nr:HflK protein [Deltaproteobacteria bacterium]